MRVIPSSFIFALILFLYCNVLVFSGIVSILVLYEWPFQPFGVNESELVVHIKVAPCSEKALTFYKKI